MHNERYLDSIELNNFDSGGDITIPVLFIHDLARSTSLQDVLNVVASWIHRLFDAERASITIKQNESFLKLYSISGSQAIPLDFLLPIEDTFVGGVFSSGQLAICDDLSLSDKLDCQMLYQNGMGCCMDAPMLQGDNCIGTLNVAHQNKYFYEKEDAIILQCLAHWLALNIQLYLQVDEMKVLASTDYLTGILNRRAFMAEGQSRVANALLTGIPCTVAILDVDNFKALNDRYGHDAGDLVLKKLAAVICTIIREHDVFARIGGEEFALIISNCSQEDDDCIFERIRMLIESLEIKYDQYVINVTASIGATLSTSTDIDISHLLRRADLALYQAKSSGKNRVVFEM
ncbi:MAG: diguanylate cyclase [Sphingomonadaceae bacterium]